MTTTLADLRVELLRLFKGPDGFGFESTATGGTATAIADSAVLQGSVEDSQAYEGQWIHRPTASGADRDKRATTIATDSLSHGGSAYGTPPANGDLYGLWIMDFREMFQTLLGVMDQIPQALLHPLCGALDLSDGDMQSTGVTSWTGVDADAAKTTTVGDVLPGMERGLQVTLTAANGYRRSVDMNVTPSRNVDIYAISRCKGAGSASLTLYDRTAGTDVAIGTALTHTQEDWTVMWRREALAAGVEKIAVGLGGVANLGVTEWAFAAVYPDNWRIYDLPTWFRRPSNLRSLKRTRFDFSSGSGLYDWRSQRNYDEDVFDYGLQRVHQGATPYNLKLQRAPNCLYWIEAQRPASDFTAWADTSAGESSPTSALDKEFLALHWAKALFESFPLTDPRRSKGLLEIGKRLAVVVADEPLQSKEERPRVLIYGNWRG